MSKTYRFEVIERKFWKNVQTGQTASIYGAIPAGEGWKMVKDGFTFRDNRFNSVGSYGSRDLRTVDEIEAYLCKHNGPTWALQHIN